MKIPSREDAARCLELRKRSKRGEHLNREEHRFCVKMFSEYRAWYAKTEAKVFNETVPFGSNVHISEESEWK